MFVSQKSLLHTELVNTNRSALPSSSGMHKLWLVLQEKGVS